MTLMDASPLAPCGLHLQGQEYALQFCQSAPKVQILLLGEKEYTNLHCGRLKEKRKKVACQRADQYRHAGGPSCVSLLSKKQQATSFHDNMLERAKEDPVATSLFEPMLGLPREF